MGKVLLVGVRNPFAVILVLLAVTVYAAFQLPRLEINIAAQGLSIDDAASNRAKAAFKQKFPGDDSLVVFFHDAELMSPEKLAVVREAVTTLSGLSFVREVVSIFAVKNVKTEDGFITSRPFFETTPTDEAGARTELADALANPLIIRNLVSPDGSTLAARVILDADEMSPELESKIVEGVETAIVNAKLSLDEVFQLGPPIVRQAISSKIRSDQVRILSGAAAVLLLTLLLMLRRLNAAFVPLMTALMSIIWTLAFMAMTGITFNVMTSIVPALLVIVGSTEDIHLLAEYYAGIRKGLEKRPALERMSRHMGTAILITGLTTYLGFLSIVANRIEILQEFAIAASTGILFNFVITALFIPAWLKITDRSRPAEPSSKAADTADAGPARQGVFLRDRLVHSRVLMVAIVALTALAAYGAMRVEVNTDPYAYFEKNDPLLERIYAVGDELAGIESFSIVLGSDIEDTFLKVKYLEEVKKLQGFIDSTGLFDKSLSFADYIAFVDRVMEDEPTAKPALPDSDDILREYMLFLDHEDVADYVSADYSTARIIVRHRLSASRDLSRAIAAIREYAQDNIDPALRVHAMGEAVSRVEATDTMVVGQVKSLGLMAVVIWLVISVLFVNAKAGLLAVIPNLFPILALFGAMGFAGIPLDTSTAMIAAIALGICIDDTMHFMARYHQRTRASTDQTQAIKDTIRDEAPAIVATSVALALGFAVFALSSFPPVVNFGLLSALVMVLALIAVFVVLPVLLKRVRLITLYDVLTLSLRREVMESCALFAGMRPSQIKKLVLLGEVAELEPGSNAIVEGEVGKDMYVVLDGEVKVSKRQEDGASSTLAQIGPGQVFGEMALVTGQPRSATVTAVTPVKLLVLHWRGIERLGLLYPRITSRLFRNLSAVLSARLALDSKR